MNAPRNLVIIAGAALCLFVGAPAAAQSKGAVPTKVQIAIHDQGTAPKASGSPHGIYTITVALPGFAAGGKSRISFDPSVTKYVDGQAQLPLAGSDTFTSSKGKLVIAFTGTHIPLNNKLTSAGYSVGPAAETGTWKITSATGSYAGWKGGGPWAAVIYGYTLNPSYSAEWDGFITH